VSRGQKRAGLKFWGITEKGEKKIVPGGEGETSRRKVRALVLSFDGVTWSEHSISRQKYHTGTAKPSGKFTSVSTEGGLAILGARGVNIAAAQPIPAAEESGFASEELFFC